MHKDTKNLIWSLAIGIGIASLVGAVLGKSKSFEIERGKQANSVAWTSFTVDSWNSTVWTTNGNKVSLNFNTNGVEVSRIVLGLRKDGTVVWREELLNGRTNSCLMFE